MRTVSELLEHIEQLRRASGRVAVATLVNTRGTTPRKEGARMVVDEHGRVLGSVTIGGCVDAQVIEESTEVLGAMKPRLLEMNLGDEEAWEIGLTCGGTIEVFVEPIALDAPSDPTLARRTVVVDGRPRFAPPERFPAVDELRVGIPSELIQSYPLASSTALVLVAHDYKYDVPVLRYALGQPVGYVGMLGSTRRANAILSLLVEDGVPRDQLARVRVPIGLDIGAQTAPEIALAVLAEIQATRAGRSGRPLRDVARERGGQNGDHD